MEDSGQQSIVRDLLASDFVDSVPDGLTLEVADDGELLVIRYERTGMRLMNGFWIFQLVFSASFAAVLQYLHLTIEPDVLNDPIPLWGVVTCWVFTACAALNVLFLRNSKATFLLDNRRLVIDSEVLGLKRHREIARQSVQKLIQFKDGGGPEESFPSWGLRIEGSSKRLLVHRQIYEKSHWLGRLLAQWADAKFVEATKE
jgi:hypothetical protein